MARINVITTSVIKSGTSASGRPWTLYDVTATKEDGTPIDAKLKSFDALAGVVDVEFEKQEHEKYGVSYMLKLKDGQPRPAAAAGGGGDTGLLHEQVTALQTRVTALEARVDALAKPATSDVPTGFEQPPTGVVGADDDIPF